MLWRPFAYGLWSYGGLASLVDGYVRPLPSFNRFREHPRLNRPNNYYWKGPCDTEALAYCIGDDSSISLVDLDQASLESFRRFTGDQVRLLLYYYPSFEDTFFRTGDPYEGTTWLNRSGPEILVGRVDCWKSPSLCSNPFNGPPSLHVSKPMNVSLIEERDYSYSNTMFSRMQEYGPSISQCLWTRYGAKALSPSCRAGLNSIYNQYPYNNDHTRSYIYRGERLARLYNWGVTLACCLLIVSLGLTGRKILRKCVDRCHCNCDRCRFNWNGPFVFQSTTSMTKEDRRVQLQQQVSLFCITVVALGICNICIPVAVLLIASPVAIGSVAWLYFVEFKGGARNVRATTQNPIADDEEKMKSFFLETLVW